MTKIMLTPQNLDTESCRFTQAADSLSCMNSKITSLVSSLDWEIRCKGRVESLIQTAASEGSKLAAEADRLGQYLKTASRTFQDADANANTSVAGMTSNAGLVLGTATGVAVVGGIISGLITGAQAIINTKLSWIKSIISGSNTDLSSSQLKTASISNSSEIDQEKRIDTLPENWPRNEKYVTPIKALRITEGFPLYSWGKKHDGIDLAGFDANHSTQLRAATSGQITYRINIGYSKNDGYFMYAYGKNIIISGDNSSFLYGHLDQFPDEMEQTLKLKLNTMNIDYSTLTSKDISQLPSGDVKKTIEIGPFPIEKGAVVGNAGSTGNSTGTHLHFEMRIDGNLVDPRDNLEIGTSKLPKTEI